MRDLEKKKAYDKVYYTLHGAKKRERRKKRYAERAIEERKKALDWYHTKKEDLEWRKKRNAISLKQYHKDPEAREQKNTKLRTLYAVKIQNPEFREAEAARKLAGYHARKQDLNFRMRRILRARLNKFLTGQNKSASALTLLGCLISFLKAYLEKQFVPGMTWENYGSIWHVDHILPCAKFHLQHSEEQEICFHYTNLQPLFAADNLSKGDKII